VQRSSVSVPSKVGTPEELERHNLPLLIAGRASRSLALGGMGIAVPIYLSVIGYGPFYIGVFFSVVALVSALLVATSGFISDRFGRKPLLVLLPLLTVLAAITFILTHNFAALVLASSFGSIGRGGVAGAGAVSGPYAPVEQAMLADSSSGANRMRNFGYMAFVGNLCAGLGAFSAGLPELVQRFMKLSSSASFVPLFVYTAIFSFIASMVSMLLYEPIRQLKKDNSDDNKQDMPDNGITAKALIMRLLVTNSINGLAVGFLAPLLSLWFYKKFGIYVGEQSILFGIVALITSLPNLSVGWIATRLGAVKATVLLRILGAFMLLAVVLAPSFIVAAFLFGVRQILQRTSIPLRQGYIMGVAPSQSRSRVAAFSSMPALGSQSITPALGGFIIEHLSLDAPFVLAALLQLINALLFYNFFKDLHEPVPEEQ
jgi:MFS family permease